ncbi:MAG TPA: hypothetical protein P5050_02055 [Bacteroidia bacterium]|mgnify:CR=1 FL=1|nr:hypothetical protein [Bacteroidia bacterium]HRS57987.1 hypothetical protein [Bacteroidia bacterium]HRU68558.1 hypothetical protein [Bacteroidia bacterium]
MNDITKKNVILSEVEYNFLVDDLIKNIEFIDEYLKNYEKNFIDDNPKLFNELLKGINKRITDKFNNIRLLMLANKWLKYQTAKDMVGLDIEIEVKSKIENFIKVRKFSRNKILSTLGQNKEETSFKWNGTAEKLRKLFNALKEKGYIAANDEYEDFEKVFSGVPIKSITKPVTWIKKTTRSKTINKKALFDLLYLMKLVSRETLSKDAKIINACFNIKFKPFQNTEKIGKTIKHSEFYSDLEQIINSL